MTRAMHAPVRVLGSYVSPYVRKVLVVLDLKGIPYEIDPVIAFHTDDIRTPIPDHRAALEAAGAPLTGTTYTTATARRGVMRT
jgi:glutathione S-transferase